MIRLEWTKEIRSAWWNDTRGTLSASAWAALHNARYITNVCLVFDSEEDAIVFRLRFGV